MKAEWKTGKPEKNGQYLCSVGAYAPEPYYKCVYFQDGEWEEDVWDIVAWQEIEPYTPPRKAVYEFDMPKHCGKCPFYQPMLITANTEMYKCRLLNKRPTGNDLIQRPEECPLEEKEYGR